MDSYTVYQHINKENGKSYVGITSRGVKARWKGGKGYKCSSAFNLAIEEYGWDAFEHIIIKDGLTKAEAEKLEKKLIKKYQLTNPKYGYNIMAGGSPCKHNKETKHLISQRLKGNELKPKRAICQYDATSGILVAEYSSMSVAAETVGASVGNICLACQGKRKVVKGYVWKYSDEKIESINPKEYDTSIFKEGRSVVQYSIYGEYIFTYKNISRASYCTGISSSAITNVCNGRGKSAGNYIWEYAEKTL